jgi:AbrB family looped-hinge helix DNA binding protein
VVKEQMVAVRVRVSSRYQIAVPSTVRQRLTINRGDHLLVDVREGHIILVPEPKSYAQRLRGLYREVWQGVDAQDYVRQERDAWTEPTD